MSVPPIPASPPTPNPPTPRMRRLFFKMSEHWGRPTRMAAHDDLHIAVWEDPAGAATAFNTLGLSEVACAADGSPIELHWLVKHPLDLAGQTAAALFLAQLAAAARAPEVRFDWHGRVHTPGGVPGFTCCYDVWLHPALTDADPDTLEDAAGAVKLLYVIPLTEYENFVLAQRGVEALLDYVQTNAIDLLTPR
ncbi:MAG: suppressor of fused domain protein [Chloracidobacterium sp.]|nr:suppressor of fused domain protein [Chloracidobacterium sp.]MDW8218273.1 hypothetical protein [Acidobacteriota bacterium]